MHRIVKPTASAPKRSRRSITAINVHADIYKSDVATSARGKKMQYAHTIVKDCQSLFFAKLKVFDVQRERAINMANLSPVR